MRRTAFVLAALLIVLTVVVYLTIDLHKTGERETLSLFQERQLLTAQQIVKHLEEYLQDRADNLESFCALPSLQYFDPTDMAADMGRLFQPLKSRHVVEISISDEQGSIICREAEAEPGAPNSDEQGRAMSESARWAASPENRGRVHVAVLQPKSPDRESSYLKVLLVKPLYQTAVTARHPRPTLEQVGSISLKLNLHKALLEQVEAASPKAPSHHAWLLGQDGTLLYHSEHPEMALRNVHQNDPSCRPCHVSMGHAEDILKARQGTLDYTVRNFPKELAAFAPLDFADAHWIIVLNSPYDEVTRFQSTSLRKSLVLLGVMVFSFLGGAILLQRNYRQKIEAEEEARHWKEKSELEERARQSEERYRTIVETAHDSIWTLDLGGNFTFVNARCEEMSGFKAQHLIGRNLGAMICADDMARMQQVFNEARRGVSQTVEIGACNQKGQSLSLSVNVVPLYERDRVVGYVNFARDITERKRAEEALRQTEIQLRQAQKMEAVGKLAGGVAHDFNNLMTAINGYSDLVLSRLADSDPLCKDVQAIRNAGERAASLTRQLLAFSRKQVLQPRVMSLNSVVADLEKILRGLVGEEVQLILQLDPQIGHVRADPGQMEQLVLNLVLNARDSMPRGGVLIAESENVLVDEASAASQDGIPAGSYVTLSVLDSGVGMDEETKAHLFEPFFITKDKGYRSGLGMATVDAIVKQSSGYIHVSSKPQEGTEVRVYFPRVDAALEDEERPRDRAEESRGDETILLVEDEEVIRSLGTQVLQKRGYTVLAAANGEDALSLCDGHKGRIDLLLTDVIMPRMNGDELARKVAVGRPEVKVLLMSGYTEDAGVHKEVGEQQTPFLQKPFSPDDLSRKVREVLDSSK